MPRSHLVEHDPDREEVAAHVGLPSPGLLRGGVVQRAEEAAIAAGVELGGGHISLKGLCQTESEGLYLTRRRGGDLGALNVAANASRLVRPGAPRSGPCGGV